MLFAADSVQIPSWSYLIPVIVTAVGLVGTGINTVLAQRVRHSVGKANGEGDLVKMNEDQLRHNAKIETKLEVIESLIISHITDSDSHGGSYAHRSGAWNR